MTAAPSRRRRWLRGGLVSLVGVGALAVPAADYSTHVADPWWGPESLVGYVALLVLSGLLITGGAWLATRDWDRQYLTTVVVSTYAVTTGVTVLFAWAIALQLWTVGDPEPYVIALDGVLIAALVGFSAGVVTAKNQRVTDEALQNEAEYRALAEEVIDRTDVATIVTDSDGELAWLNQAAAGYFGLDRTAAIGRDRDAVIADVLEECTAPEGFDDSQATHCHVPPTADRSERWLAYRSHPIDEGLHAGGRIEQYTDVTAEHEAVEALTSRKRGLEQLVDTVCTPAADLDDRLSTLLRAGAEQVGVEYGSFASVDASGQYRLAAAYGDESNSDRGPLPGAQIRCRQAVEQADGVVSETQPFDPAVGGFQFDHAATDGGVTNAGYERYLGAPVRVDGDHVGTLCFLGRESTPFGEWEEAIASLLAQLLAFEFAQEHGVEGTGGDAEKAAYEQAIQQERERLEFINRFVRHNLLNGLNLVNARAEHLEEAVGDDTEAAAHLEIIRSRVEEMSAVVDTIRTFMNTVVDDAAALDSVALGPRLVEAVEEAAGRYNASFTAYDLPDSDHYVVANELIEEVFENVLANAIEHNDATDPAIEVWASETVEELPLAAGEAVDPKIAVQTEDEGELSVDPVEPEKQRALTVYIADNGPGIDEETRQRLLTGSDVELDDPGHGFGFYLVRETMARYGGGVRIRENEPRGTVVELVFPLAE